jgi:hypothetical protein
VTIYDKRERMVETGEGFSMMQAKQIAVKTSICDEGGEIDYHSG